MVFCKAKLAKLLRLLAFVLQMYLSYRRLIGKLPVLPELAAGEPLEKSLAIGEVLNYREKNMSKIDMVKFSLVELEELRIELNQHIEARRHRERSMLREKMAEMAAKAGFSIDELFNGVSGKKMPLPPKYRNPDDATQTWSGRGRKPNWLEERVSAGADQESFLIE